MGKFLERDRQLDRLIGDIYAAGLSPDGWGEVLLAIERALDSDFARLFFHDRSPIRPVSGWMAFGHAEPLPENTRRHLAARDGRMSAIASLPPGIVYVDNQDAILACLQDDFHWPAGMAHGMGISLFAEGMHSGILSAHHATGKGGFLSHEVTLLERLAPHIVRSIQLQRRLAHADAVTGALLAGLDHFPMAVLLVDQDGLVAQMNGAADRLLRQPGCGLQLEVRRLATSLPADAAILRRIIRTAAGARAGDVEITPELLRLGRPGGPTLGVMAAPVRRHLADAGGLPAASLALVFVTDPAINGAPDHGLLASQFGLSPAEAVVATRLCCGDSVETIADQRGVSRDTVRVQIKNMLAKTQMRSQSQLVGLIGRSFAILRRPTPRETG